MKIAHIISGLSRGGAEAVLVGLVSNDLVNSHEVIVLKGKGYYWDVLSGLGINLYALNMSNGSLNIVALVRLYKYLRIIKPDLVQTWMFHADLVGGVLAKFAGVNKVFWGVHSANIQLLPWPTKFIAYSCSFLSYIIPSKVACCGVRAKEVMADNFYNKKCLTVVYNGYDENIFTVNGPAISRSLISPKLNGEDFLVGFVARWDVHKDIYNLLDALRVAVQSNSKIKCLFVGLGLDQCNNELVNSIINNNLMSNVVLLGERDDIPEFMRTVDIVLLSSISEAFPNVLAESMLCGTPCISTDVGDAKAIIAKNGWVVPCSDHEALSKAIIEAANEYQCNSLDWSRRQKQCRDRIINKYSISNMVDKYVEMWVD